MRYYLVITAVLLLSPVALAQPDWGTFPDGGTLYFYTNTVGTDGVAETIASEAIAVYKDSSATELTATITKDFDTRTGFHQIAIDTTQSGFDAASTYTVVYTAGTVDSVSVAGRIIGSFKLGVVPSNILQWNSAAIATPDTAGYPKVTVKDGTGTGEIDTASGAIETVNNVHNLDGDTPGDAIGAALDGAGYTGARAQYLDKLQFLPSATAGAAGGLFIAGTNAPVTITGSGNALTLTSTGGNGKGLSITAYGSGDGISVAGGTLSGRGVFVNGGATGVLIQAGANGGNGLEIFGSLNGSGLVASGQGTGHGALFTSGNGLTGNGIQATAASTNGNGFGLAGAGTGSGLSGNIAGNLSGSVGSVTGAVGSISGVTFPANFSGLTITDGRVDANVTHVLGSPVCD